MPERKNECFENWLNLWVQVKNICVIELLDVQIESLNEPSLIGIAMVNERMQLPYVFGPWRWLSNGQRACPLFRQPELESFWVYSFYSVKLFEKNANNREEAGDGPLKKECQCLMGVWWEKRRGPISIFNACKGPIPIFSACMGVFVKERVHWIECLWECSCEWAEQQYVRKESEQYGEEMANYSLIE